LEQKVEKGSSVYRKEQIIPEEDISAFPGKSSYIPYRTSFRKRGKNKKNKQGRQPLSGGVTGVRGKTGAECCQKLIKRIDEGKWGPAQEKTNIRNLKKSLIGDHSLHHLCKSHFKERRE